MKNILIILLLISTNLCFAEDNREDDVHDFVSDMMFEEGILEYVSFKVSSRGGLDINLPSDIPDEDYERILTQLKNNKLINGVLAGRSSRACGRW